MAVRITHTNNSSGHDGTYVYRSTATMDPQALPAPIADAPPVALGATFEYIDDPADGTYYYRTQDHESGQVSAVSAEQSITLAPDYSSATIGDEIGGGIYAGIDTIGGSNYYVIAGKAASEVSGLKWKTSDTETPGTTSTTDGLANTLAMETAGLSDHPAAAHCLSYTGGGNSDWHMPAISQVTLIYNNLAGHPEFADNVASGDYTWSSTENASIYAEILKLSTGGDTIVGKSTTMSIWTRPIRRIPV